VATVAFIGLGSMGERIAGRLVDAGYDLTAWDRTPAKADALVARGAQLAATPAAAASGADFVITMVANPDALRDVTEGQDGVVAGAGAGTVVIEMSTSGPTAVSRLASALDPATRIVDAPVLGSIGEAEGGTLTIFVGGDDDVVERCMPLLAHLGTPIHVGGFGAGAAAKLVANSTLVTVIAALGEALALADALGLERDVAFQVLGTTALAAQAERRREAIESGDFSPRFKLELALKDAGLIEEAAEASGVDLRLVPAAQSWLADAERAGLGDRDYSAVLAQILG
jgi:3-hydroxyisobutyrate dehydrogenase-like beta-hydroxyacid dehydrogenase